MPVKRSRAPGPHSSSARSTTSVSVRERKACPSRSSSAAQQRVVVELAVVGDPGAPVAGGHRHVAGGGEVDDREPRRAQAGRAEQLLAAVVGPAVMLRRVHAPHERQIRLAERRAIQRDHADQPAHLGSASALRARELAPRPALPVRSRLAAEQGGHGRSHVHQVPVRQRRARAHPRAARQGERRRGGGCRCRRALFRGRPGARCARTIATRARPGRARAGSRSRSRRAGRRAADPRRAPRRAAPLRRPRGRWRGSPAPRARPRGAGRARRTRRRARRCRAARARPG